MIFRNYSSLLAGTKRHYLDMSNNNGDDDQDYDDSSYVMADTVMEPESSPLSSVTITRTNPGSASIPSRRSLITSGNAARTLANLMAAKDCLGNGSFSIGTGNGLYSALNANGAYSSNGMSMSNTSLSSNNGTHVIVPNGGYTVPRTISQTTITPAVTVTPTIVPNPKSSSNNNSSSSGHTNGHSNGKGGNENGHSGNSNNGNSNNSTGPNYFFGQYIASVLDSLPQAESLLTRHKLQEILFEAQSRVSHPQKQFIDFKCANCCKIYQGSAQLPWIVLI